MQDDNLEHELDYTKALLDVVSADETLINVPKVKERLNMLRETLADIEDHYVTFKKIEKSPSPKFRLGDFDFSTYCDG